MAPMVIKKETLLVTVKWLGVLFLVIKLLERDLVVGITV
jgi:hypothetical protein